VAITAHILAFMAHLLALVKGLVALCRSFPIPGELEQLATRWVDFSAIPSVSSREIHVLPEQSDQMGV
jgi:hypothetical protein